MIVEAIESLVFVTHDGRTLLLTPGHLYDLEPWDASALLSDGVVRTVTLSPDSPNKAVRLPPEIK